MGLADVRAGTQKYYDLLGTRPNISESHSEIRTLVPLCIAQASSDVIVGTASGYSMTAMSVGFVPGDRRLQFDAEGQKCATHAPHTPRTARRHARARAI